MVKYIFMNCENMEFDSDWKPSKDEIIEIKEDGCRTMLFFNDNKVKLMSERGDCSIKYPEIAEKFKTKMDINEITVDGEIVVMKDGRSDFNKLLMRNTEDKFKINILRKTNKIKFIVFDVLSINNGSVTRYPLHIRKNYLKNAIVENSYVQLAKDYSNEYTELVKRIREKKLEGFIIKKKDSIYVKKRSPYWKKVKFKKETVLKMTNFEIHKDGNGVTYHNNFDRVSVNGQGSKKGIADIKKNGFCLIETQYLRKNPSNHLFQPVFKRWGK